MLQRLRQHHTLRTWVLGVFAALWLVALASGNQVRMVLPLLHSASTATSSAEMAGMAYCGAMPTQAELTEWLVAADDGAASPDDAASSSAHSPACLLCIALAAPQTRSSVLYRPPQLGWYTAQGNPSASAWGQEAAAPLPARGPPVSTFLV